MAFIDRSHETLADKISRAANSDEGHLIMIGAAMHFMSMRRKARKAQKARAQEMDKQDKIYAAKHAILQAKADKAVDLFRQQADDNERDYAEFKRNNR